MRLFTHLPFFIFLRECRSKALKCANLIFLLLLIKTVLHPSIIAADTKKTQNPTTYYRKSREIMTIRSFLKELCSLKCSLSDQPANIS